jgi:hypothetical protein
MVFREVSVIEIREVLRAWLSGLGLRRSPGRRVWTERPRVAT